MRKTHRITALTAGLLAAWLACLLVSPGPAVARESFRERLKNRDQPAAGETPPGPVNRRIDGPGHYTFTMERDGITRMYRVHVPSGYSAARPAPLVMAFHGGGGNMNYQADDRYYGLVSKSEQTGYILVFPNGYSRLRGGKLASWNAGICCAGARDRNIDDVGFVREMLDQLRGQLNIDPNRVFATGMSNGALFSHRLACEMSETFKAIASVAGADGTKSCNPKVPVSILEIHAKNDEMVLFNGGAGRDSKMLADFPSVADTIGKWVQRNGCHSTPKRVLDKPGAYCDAYTGCRANAEVRLCVTESGGHSWPGGHKVRTGEAGSSAISANDVMWEFFESRR